MFSSFTQSEFGPSQRERIDESKASSHRLLGGVLVRLRVAEIHQHSIAHVLGDKAAEMGDRIGDTAMIRSDDLTQVLGIQTRRERRRADEINEHDGQLSTLGDRLRRRGF